VLVEHGAGHRHHPTALGFTIFRPEGTYFATTDIRSIGEEDGVAFCYSLAERCGVVAVPSAVFYEHPEEGRPLVRWAFCKRPELLDEALTRLEKLRMPHGGGAG
jgi:N-succinyldiaminopimelate aminotransferase